MANDDREESAPVPRPRRASHHKTDVALAVATLAFRQRPNGVTIDELATPLECTLIADGEILARCAVLDISADGVGFLVAPEVPLWKGMRFHQVQLRQANKTVAEGAATILDLSGEAERRAELSFAFGEIDLGALRLRDGSPLDPGGATPAASALPADWRAAVAELGQILRGAGEHLAVATRPLGGTLAPTEEQEVFARFFQKWGPRCLGSLARLHDLSSGFDPAAAAAAREHAKAQLRGSAIEGPILAPPAHGAIDDQAVPSLFKAATRDGASVSERFFQHAWARFPLVRTVLARPRWLAELWDGLRGHPRARVLVLQPGGVAELEEVQLPPEAELTLLEASAAARMEHEPQWRKRWTGAPECLRIDLRPPTGLPPRADGEAPYDLVYGAGVLGSLDDEQARALIRELHARLAPGGRLVLGNLRAEPASTWLLDFVFDWPIRYREVQDLGGMVEELSLPAASWQVGSDPTGRTAVLDLVR